MKFNATRTYQSDLDVRDWSLWRERLRGEPEGVIWALIGPRRSGKTWALRALESRDTVYVDLQGNVDGLKKDYNSSCLLVDEPGKRLRHEGFAFLERCAELKLKGIRVLIAMTPGEWQYLTELDPEEQRIKARDCLTLPLLTHQQAVKLARTKTAGRLLSKLPADWRRNPFLLELLFETAEQYPHLDLDGLILTTIRLAYNLRLRYVSSVFEEGLSDSQRSILRQIARREGTIQETSGHALLRECGLIEVGPRIADPILCDHFRMPLVVHHISDVHFGPKSATGIDRKEGGRHGNRLARAAGGNTVSDDYLAYLEGRGSGGPHAVLVSGDLVETGTSEQYESARGFLDRLSHLLADHPDLRPGDPRIAIVGGNHDVDWAESRGSVGARKRHLAFARHMDGYPHPHLEAAPEARSLTTIVWPGVGVEIALLGSAEFGGEEEEDETQGQLVQLINELMSRAIEAFEADELQRFDQINKRVSRLDPGLVDYRDLKRLESHGWTQPIRLAMLHHPVSPMPVATEIARFGGLTNAGAVKASLLRAGVCLVLHGHQHSGWFGCESWPGRYEERQLRIAAAPTLGSRETIENLGFNEIHIYREGSSHYEIKVRRMAYNGSGWDGTKDLMSFRFS